MSMNLGDLIDRLAALPPETRIFYMFGGVPDMTVRSYRGYYHQTALGWRSEHEMYAAAGTGAQWPTAGTLGSSLYSQVGESMTGYKGGTYTIRRDEPVWCSLYGDASSCAIDGVSDYGAILIGYER